MMFGKEFWTRKSAMVSDVKPQSLVQWARYVALGAVLGKAFSESENPRHDYDVGLRVARAVPVELGYEVVVCGGGKKQAFAVQISPWARRVAVPLAVDPEPVKMTPEQVAEIGQGGDWYVAPSSSGQSRAL